MTLKIFLSILLTSVASVIVTLMFTFLCDNSVNELFGIFSYVTIIVCAMATILSKNIVKPVRNIDLDHPKPKKSYKELFPVLERLRVQNGKVNRQRTEIMNSREQFSTITENMKEGIIIADSKTVILACNSGTYRLLGISPLEKGQSIYALSREEVFRRCIQDAMGGRNAECLLRTELGDRKVIASPASVSETVNGIVVFILDVTEQQKLENMRREFTSNVSHELKTPLTTIYGIADMLAGGMVKPEDCASFGRDICNEADRLISLIDDIVSLSKLDEDSVLEQDEPVDLYNLSSEILLRLNKNATEKNISSSLSGEHITVTGNRTILDEIIYNLCDNAIKYNVDGGKFEVKISHIPMKAIITVSDTGTGIPEEHIERIFERFYRVDKSRSRKIKGTGLGLSIVKHGVNYHGGTVRAVSSENGSSFIVELPIK